jgi:hypothetical protein
MSTGVKISELDEATAIQATALIELVQAGDNFKVPYSLLVPLIAGIGNAAITADAGVIDFDDIDVTFLRGTILNVQGTNLEVLTANGPDTGLLDGDPVSWNVFTFGSEEEVTQLAFSTFADAQIIKIRNGNIYSDSTWAAWASIGEGGGGGVGLGVAPVVDAAVIDFNDLAVTFLRGNIVNVEGTNLEVITANGPDNGLAPGNIVNWNVFTFGSSEDVTQVAYSTFSNAAQQIQIRNGNIASGTTWTSWAKTYDANGGGAADLLPVYTGVDNVISFGASSAGTLDFKRSADLGNGYSFITQEIAGNGLPPETWFGIVAKANDNWGGVFGAQIIVQFSPQTGSASIAVCRLSDNIFALFTASRKWEAYEFTKINDLSTNFETEGLLTLISNPVSFPTPAITNNDWVSLANLEADGELVIFDSGTNNLQRMFFDGFDFSAVSGPLNLPLATGQVEISALTNSSIALFSPNEDKLYYITFSAGWFVESSLLIASGTTLYKGLTAVSDIDVFLSLPNGEINNYRLVDGAFIFNKLVETIEQNAPFDKVVIDAGNDKQTLFTYTNAQTISAGPIEYQIGEGEKAAKGKIVEQRNPSGLLNKEPEPFFSNQQLLTALQDNRLGDFAGFDFDENAFFGPSDIGAGLIYQGAKPAWFNVSFRTNAYALNLSSTNATLALGINGLAWEATRQRKPLNNVPGSWPNYNAQILLNPADEIAVFLRPDIQDTLEDSDSYFLKLDFDRFELEGRPNLQENLFLNPDLVNQNNITTLGASLNFTTGKIEIFSTGAVGVLRLDVAGLEIGQRYRIEIPCNETDDSLGFSTLSSSTFCTFETQEVRPNNGFTTVDVIATATSGYVEFTLGNQAGVKMFIYAGISIRAYL